jgi:hypothetical protein
MTDEKLTLDEKLRDNRALIAEVQRLTAELALKDQALDEIKALAQALPSAGFRNIDDDYERGSRHAKDDLKREIQRILTRLDTQEENQ